MRFKVRTGLHIGDGRDYKKGDTVVETFEVGERVYKKGDKIEEDRVRAPSKWYYAGKGKASIVTTDIDLVKKHGTEKFERLPERPVDDGEVEVEEGLEFERMTVHQLREYAEAEEIDLKHAGRKDDLIKIIRAHETAKAQEAKE